MAKRPHNDLVLQVFELRLERVDGHVQKDRLVSTIPTELLAILLKQPVLQLGDQARVDDFPR